MDKYLEANGCVMRILRERKGLSAGFVAKQLGWKSRQFVYNIECGKAALPAKSVTSIAKIYGVPKLALINLYSAQRFMRYTAEE